MMNQKMMSRPEAEPYNRAELRTLQRLVDQGENQTLEFKQKANFPEKIIREMAAFANTRGGKLLVGISDDGAIVGLKFPEEDSHVIMCAAQKYCRPQLRYSEYLIPVGNNKFVLVLDIPESKKKPHYVGGEDLQRVYYIRNEDKSIQASKEIVEIIRRKQRQKDIRFRYGDQEKQLIQYLAQNNCVTLEDYIKLSRLNRYQASRKLVLLVLANVLHVSPGEKGDSYSLKPDIKLGNGGM